MSQGMKDVGNIIKGIFLMMLYMVLMVGTNDIGINIVEDNGNSIVKAFVQCIGVIDGGVDPNCKKYVFHRKELRLEKCHPKGGNTLTNFMDIQNSPNMQYMLYHSQLLGLAIGNCMRINSHVLRVAKTTRLLTFNEKMCDTRRQTFWSTKQCKR